MRHRARKAWVLRILPSRAERNWPWIPVSEKRMLPRRVEGPAGILRIRVFRQPCSDAMSRIMAWRINETGGRSTYIGWCVARGCSHAHCPHDCESPQPFVDGERLLCGRCWHLEGIETEMVPCTPEMCAER